MKNPCMRRASCTSKEGGMLKVKRSEIYSSYLSTPSQIGSEVLRETCLRVCEIRIVSLSVVDKF